MGARAPSYNDPDRHVAEILNVILGEGMSSRLFLELREHRGLVYDVHSFMSRMADTGVLGIGLACEPRQAATALEAAVVELRKLAETPVGDAELTKAREYAKGRLLLGLESTSALCEYAGQQLLLQGKIVEPEELVARLRVSRCRAGQRARGTPAQRRAASRGGGTVPQRDTLREGDRGVMRRLSDFRAVSLERTLVLVKPDGVQRRLIGEVITRFERRGLHLVALKLLAHGPRARRASLRRTSGQAVLRRPGRVHHLSAGRRHGVGGRRCRRAGARDDGRDQSVRCRAGQHPRRPCGQHWQ